MSCRLLSWLLQWGWITLYVVTIVVAVLGNLLFILGSLCTRRSRNTGHYLLINLSVRDILLAGLCIPATLDSEIIHLTWNLGLEFCISFRSVVKADPAKSSIANISPYAQKLLTWAVSPILLDV